MAWMTQDAPLRFVLRANSASDLRLAPVLQQIWVDSETGKREWRDVPLVYDDAALPPLSTITVK
jgi:hypothetical protein